MEGSPWFGHLTQEVLQETRAQDVLSVRLIGVKGHFLSVISDNMGIENIAIISMLRWVFPYLQTIMVMI